MPSADFIIFKNVTYAYGNHVALKEIKLSIPQGSFWAVVGPNGGGKSTLLKLLCGLLKPSRGSLILPLHRPSNIGYLPQRHDIDLTFPLLAGQVVAMGLWEEVGHFKRLKPTHETAISETLQKVGLQGFEKRRLSTLSGGQLQRLFFARLMIQNPNLILLDEPFAAVDQPTQHDLMKLIQSWHNQGKTIIVVLHDVTMVRRYFPYTALISNHLVAAGPTAETLHPENLMRATFVNV